MAAFEPISLSDLAGRARQRGVPSAYRACASEPGLDAPPVFVDFEVDGVMCVRMLTPGYEPVIENSAITGFRPVPVDPFTVADQGVITMIEMLRRFTRNGATIAEGAALTVAFLRDARNQPQEET